MKATIKKQMTARAWHGVVPADKADAYYRYMERTGIADYRSSKGNRGVMVFQRQEEDVTHFLLLTFWDSLESIRKFAGDEIRKARYYPQDSDYLLELEPYVVHYKILDCPEEWF